MSESTHILMSYFTRPRMNMALSVRLGVKRALVVVVDSEEPEYHQNPGARVPHTVGAPDQLPSARRSAPFRPSKRSNLRFPVRPALGLRAAHRCSQRAHI